MVTDLNEGVGLAVTQYSSAPTVTTEIGVNIVASSSCNMIISASVWTDNTSSTSSAYTYVGVFAPSFPTSPYSTTTDDFDLCVARSQTRTTSDSVTYRFGANCVAMCRVNTNSSGSTYTNGYFDLETTNHELIEGSATDSTWSYPAFFTPLRIRARITKSGTKAFRVMVLHPNNVTITFEGEKIS